jgi:hypothetical protein
MIEIRAKGEKKAIDWGASEKTLRKTTWKPKGGDYQHLKGKWMLKVGKCLSSLRGAKKVFFLIKEKHNKC